ncbi:eukaryotic initiation factor [Haematococcus lacustris]
MAGRGYGGRGGAGFARPENALKRAEELENVGQKGNALQVLHDIITSKKHRTWSKTYETIMFKHIDLVVDMKKRNYGKEALMQYRNMCQAVNIASLEEVIKYYLKKASDKAEEAQSKAAAVTIDVADLEEDASPEDIMLSYVSGDKSKDRTDRELVTPWFRFLWEAYRSVLEILRTNPKLEPVYAMTANKAFHFCLQFKRTAEFRRLCDILRQHLTNSTNRYREAPTAESLQLHMDTRFEQLKVACDLEMWAEAFRSVEDIQSLILLQKKSPKQQSMATYYARLTQIFAVSENHLYNAYAWLKLFNFSRSFNKNMTPADFQAMSSSVLLAMLSILPYDVKQGQALDEMAVDQEKERILRMANILGYQVDANKDYRTVLSRAALLSSVGAVNVLALVPPEIRQIHELLTSEFAPLELCRRMAPLLAKLGETTHSMSASSPVKEVALGQYVNQLKQVTVLRLLKQLSEVFSSLKISTLESLVPFMPLSEVEAVVVDAVKCEYLQMRIDHRQGTLHFGSQQLESEQVCSHLQLLSQRLSTAVAMERAGAVSAAQAAKKAEIVALALENTEALHSLAHARKLMIEKRKEDAENALLEAERESQRLREQQEQDAARLAERRAKEDALRREKDRIEAELQEQEKQELMAMMEARMKSGKVGSKLAAVMKGAEGKELDRDTILREAQAERLKEQQELERKMTKVARQLDHLERARREEEAPVLARLAAEREAEERALYEESVRQEAVRHRAGWEQDMADRVRILKTLDDKAVFEAQVIARRREEFEEYRRQQLAKQAQRRAQRRAEITSQRIERFLEQCRKEVAVRVADIEAEEAARLKEEKKKVGDPDVQDGL